MSRLLNNSDEYREFLESRNLYTPETPYDANASNTVNTINTIVNFIQPFSTFDLSNTVVGRLVGNNTPLAQIGLEMLGSQFAQTAASNAAAEFLPTVSFANLFDGDPSTKLITTKVDFQITRRETQTNVGRILEEISGVNPLNGNPFSPNSNNLDFVKNSGKGQLQTLYENINRNKYKPSSQGFVTTSTDEGFDYGNLEGATNRQYFPDNDTIFYPYNQYKVPKTVSIPAINNVLNEEINSFRSLTQSLDNYLEYGANQEYVDALGKSFIRDNNNGAGQYRFEFFAEQNYGLEDDPTQQIVWGRDGVNSNYRDDAIAFDNPVEGVEPSEEGGTVNKTTDFSFANNEDAFNMNAGGLLSFTRELLNTKGRYASFDVTRKKFIDENEQLHFNGSPLTTRLDDQLDRSRQHNIVDPYNRYVKAIRYNGNKIYNGNQNSVIYNSVIPTVTPTNGDRGIDRNLMFSIENLAYQVTVDEINNVAYAADESKVELPLCEAGPNGGRVMWFPPYDIQLTENVVVNRETTNFIGRGEPIYTYANTERLANLSFKLIIDYPPQVKGLDHVQASRFFAFGGEVERTPSTNIGEKIRRREELIQQRDNIKGKKKLLDPQIPDFNVSFYFANDEPKIGFESTTVQKHVDINYEFNPDDGNGPDGRNTKLNVGFLEKLDRAIAEILADDEKRPFVKIELVGSASELFLGSGGEEYNQLLSERRIAGIRSYIEDQYLLLVNRTLDQDGVEIVTDPRGGQGGILTDDPEEIPTDPAKQARRVDIRFTRNDFQQEVEVPISDAERETRDQLDSDIEALDREISQQRSRTDFVGCDFNAYTIEDGVLKGFNATENKKYKPAFHSQTPEDFHRRLTFLQQCTRQGEAVRKVRDNNNSFSAKNAVFGRQPVQVLRLGDFFHTKVIIDSMQLDYTDAPWDMNPEGMGMQFMIADVKLQLKIIGGQSLKGAINILQNAVSYNYYANSTFYNDGVYINSTTAEDLQFSQQNGTSSDNGNVNTTENDPMNPRQAMNGMVSSEST